MYLVQNEEPTEEEVQASLAELPPEELLAQIKTAGDEEDE